jgi:DNA gyrase/topoisomerase IV subunit A
VKDAFETGRGKIILRAKVSIESEKTANKTLLSMKSLSG